MGTAIIRAMMSCKEFEETLELLAELLREAGFKWNQPLPPLTAAERAAYIGENYVILEVKP